MTTTLLSGRLENGNDGIFVIGHHQHAAELVQERLELRAPHVLVVHDLLQVVVAPEIVQQPARFLSFVWGKIQLFSAHFLEKRFMNRNYDPTCTY